MVRLDQIDWGEIYAGIIAGTGWTWEYIDENMTLPRVISLNKHWAEFPPVHIGLTMFSKAFLGTGKKKPDKRGNLQDLMQAFGMAGGRINHGR